MQLGVIFNILTWAKGLAPWTFSITSKPKDSRFESVEECYIIASRGQVSFLQMTDKLDLAGFRETIDEPEGSMGQGAAKRKESC